MARVKSPRFCMNIAVASIAVAASDWPARSAWKASPKLLKVSTAIGFRPFLTTMSATSRVRRSSMPPSSTAMRRPARSSTVLKPSGLPLAARKLIAACSTGIMYISLDRSSVQKIPVLIMSQRLAARPGIMVANSVRMYSGARPSLLQHSLASSTRMPFSSPFSSTNCSGGRVGLIDMISVPALMMVGGATLGWARREPGSSATAGAIAPAFRRERRRNLISDIGTPN